MGNVLLDLAGDSVQPRTRWYLSVLSWFAAGIFFFGLGVYGLMTSLGNLTRFFLFGILCCFLSFRIFWEAVQYVRPTKSSVQKTTYVCPFCGAIVEKHNAVCAKCKREITIDC